MQEKGISVYKVSFRSPIKYRGSFEVTSPTEDTLRLNHDIHEPGQAFTYLVTSDLPAALEYLEGFGNGIASVTYCGEGVECQ